MSTGNLSLKITVGGTNFFVSDDEFLASNAVFHFGFIQRAPFVELAPSRGGWSNFRAGQIVLENRPHDSNHPFGGSRYQDLVGNPSTTYAFVLNFGVLAYDWIIGVLVLETIRQDDITFSMYPKEYSVSPVGTVSDKDGNTVTKPFTFGAVTHFDELIQTGATTFSNPTLNTSGLTFFEDGSSETINTLTSSTITVNTYGSGEPSLTDSNAKTLEQFFDFVAGSSGLNLTIATAETSKAPSAGSLAIKIRQVEQKPLVHIAGDVAEAYNHQFFIAKDTSNSNQETLFLVDRGNTPTSFTDIEEDTIVDAQFIIGFPLGGVSADYDICLIQNSKIVKYEQSIRAENKPVGQEMNVNAYADLYADRATIATLLTNIKNIENKAQASVTVPDIQVGYQIGDRFKFQREIDFLSADLLCRSIVYDFENRTTTVSGDATLGQYVFKS